MILVLPTFNTLRYQGSSRIQTTEPEADSALQACAGAPLLVKKLLPLTSLALTAGVLGGGDETNVGTSCRLTD
jgi:hypothetical protein